MTNAEFNANLKKAFRAHMFMKERNKHIINELLYVLEHDDAFKGDDYNISIIKIEGGCICISSLEAFVSTKIRGVWFDDNEIEFEVEELGKEKFNCITIYESEVS
jgi:hypothetical protein